uniref:POU-specific atypical domain-containing protein n=1 Tax=Branchiostoma floridae TaxID=7739 RepID=C3YP96_BRAFL|eukprot:XP_002601668.1 hypothetical protein BRAFLDRAFT_94544 [Branchiostoma floridae]
MELNAEIKTFLLNHDIGQEAVATEIGVSISSVSVFLKHGWGLNTGKRTALYTWYLRQKHTESEMPGSTHLAEHSTWTPAMHAIPTQLATVPGLLLCMQYPLSWPQYLDACCACSTLSAEHST